VFTYLLCAKLSRCVKLTDDGLKEVLQKCSSLETLNLDALSR